MSFVRNFATYITDIAASDGALPAIVGPKKGEEISYKALSQQAGSLAQFLSGYHVKRLVLLADRTIGAYIGVLATAWNGIAYVPLSLKAPSERIVDQLVRSESEAILIDENGLKILTPELIAVLPELVIASDADIRQKLSEKNVKSFLIETFKDYAPPKQITGKEEAYIIFTSGSSGTPKGVVLSTLARDVFVRNFHNRHAITFQDRVAQPVDLSWDVSVANMACAFLNGAPLYLMSFKAILSPARFILLNGITVWHSVTLIADILLERGTLTENVFPKLRWTSFGGATLFPRAAFAWQKAAPNGVLFHRYGPTEMAVDCLDYRVPSDFDGGAIPIGRPYPQTEALILKEDTSIADIGEVGELLLSGPQQAEGYLNDSEKTDSAFIWKKDKQDIKRRWYKTGDLVLQDKEGLFYFKGRIDHQLKVLGYRVELEEIEFHIRKATGIEQVAVAGYPLDTQSVSELIAFAVIPLSKRVAYSTLRLKELLSKNLPPYMVPHRFFALDHLPQMENGKLNRKMLADCVRAENEI